ncbi:MAG TPA: class I SAM-dependent rRNA methyltransferase [Leptolyngbyaceae cyanobacterium M33_DOE_097]|uniref:Class I SAM-dependent rRNA methyltransferase n=1 Tax=Oscillatoriales cyanobacterium SpSt-418 TaxID=2282169 RepID=A0A7C3PIF7_9CYAN|nr:class I SAM-dependent rRNA methyltransferase [Leptolyngbyaceae cyanobacterium M33_DOE_097]
MPNYPSIVIHQKKIDAIKRFHPWIFSGALKTQPDDLPDGAVVEAYSQAGEYLATGFYTTGSIAIKILSFEKVHDVRTLIVERIQQAYALRERLGFTQEGSTNCYRLVNSEGDQLPGLIIDWYNGTAVLQAHALGIYQLRDAIIDGLQQVYGSDLKAVYDKSAATLGKKARTEVQNEYLYGAKTEGIVLENDHRFLVDWETGQKTGFFLDQRENRKLLGHFAADKKVLNAFCYSGGFSVYAIAANAKVVHSVDSSTRAIEGLETNLQLNPATDTQHITYAEDVFTFLKDCDSDYDVIVLDPPAFAKSLSARHQAMQAYRRLNLQAFSKLKKGGILFTFSCSQVVGTEHFTGAVTAGAIDAGRETRVLYHLDQPADHPTSIYHPEGRYLKGLVLAVN